MVGSKELEMLRPAQTAMAPKCDARTVLLRGVAIPAHPLALSADRRLDERRQRALSRYYLASGAGGLAVGVHTTQFRIHDPSVGLLEPVLTLAAEEMDRAEPGRSEPFVRVAGICGETKQAVAEARLARDLGYQFGLVNMGALRGSSVDQMVDHCRALAEVIGLFGFYLQPKVGGVSLPLEFWRRLCQIEQLAAIKVAAFDRYKTWEVVRAVGESGRRDVALYTGNDDSIVVDLLSNYCVSAADTVDTPSDVHFSGGLLGQWAVWTSQAAVLLKDCQRARAGRTADGDTLRRLLQIANDVTDANAAIFDASHDFQGCLPGIHEVLRRQGMLANNFCLDEHEVLSPGQANELDRVSAAYPHLQDDHWIAERLDDWLRG